MSKQNKNFQFKGKQILLLGLVALVITAGYYRWNIEKEQLSLAVPAANEMSDGAVSDGENQEQSDNNGQGSESSSTDEITKLKQTRDTSRSQSTEEWTKITKSNDASAENKKDAEKRLPQRLTTQTKREK